jgi:signal transduction histidine kinase
VHPISVAEVVEQVKASMADIIAENECTVEVDVEPGLPSVLADGYAVRGCLHNLITNAIKYSGYDHRIRVLARLHQLEGGREEVRVKVEDHGTGISSSELQRIFEPFYRSPGVRAAQIRGTGLGLFIARHLAEAMGGRISVSSQLGVGSIFTIHLPVPETDETGGPPDFSAKPEVTQT